jgi:hypothetical protein
MFRFLTLILLAATVLAICVAVGEVRISFAGSEALPEELSTTLGELRQPVEGFLDGAAHAAVRRLPAPAPRQGGSLPDMHDPAHSHHSHDHKLAKVG